MLNFFKQFSKQLAIDLGTANTLVYVPRKGIVLNEPSVVAFDNRNNKIVAVGQKAKEIFGRTPKYITSVRPLKDGVIADFKMATTMLKYFIKAAITKSRFLHPKIVIAVPFGITEVEKKAVREAAFQVGARRVVIILEPMAAAIGAGLPVQDPSGNMVVDIGGGTTDVAVITMAGIVSGRSLKIAGDEMDEVIIRHIRQKYSLLIGLRTAELIKKIIGSAFPLNIEQYVDIRGQDLTCGIPGMRSISSKEIREALTEPVLAIVEAVRQTLEETPPEVAADIMGQGMILTGGGSLLRNLDCKIQEEIGVPVFIADDPLTSVVMGTGKAMSEPDLLKNIAVS